MRHFVAGTLCMALQVGAFTAPLVHAHPDDDHVDHHQPAAVHVHFGGHHGDDHGIAQSGAPSSTIVSGSEPEQTTQLQIFVAVETADFASLVLPPARFTLACAPESVMRRQPDMVRSHGPPPSRTASPRAPPVLSA